MSPAPAPAPNLGISPSVARLHTIDGWSWSPKGNRLLRWAYPAGHVHMALRTDSETQTKKVT